MSPTVPECPSLSLTIPECSRQFYHHYTHHHHARIRRWQAFLKHNLTISESESLELAVGLLSLSFSRERIFKAPGRQSTSSDSLSSDSLSLDDDMETEELEDEESEAG